MLPVLRHLARLGCLAAVLSPAALGLHAGLAGEPTPMTDEEVVKLLVAGTPVARVLEEIASRPPAFDLSDEMVEELRRAGVPQVVLDAMARKQKELMPAQSEEEPQPASAASPGPLVVELRVRDTSGNAVPLAVPAQLSPQAAAALGDSGLAKSPDAVDGLAVFLACTTARHVPDFWRNQSPLGRDFQMPRHRMLLFLPGGEPVQGRRLPSSLSSALPSRARRQTWVAFTPPPEAEVALDRTEAHDLLVGVAMQAGGRYVRLAAEPLPGWRAPGGADRIRLRIVVARQAGAPALTFHVEPATDPETH